MSTKNLEIGTEYDFTIPYFVETAVASSIAATAAFVKAMAAAYIRHREFKAAERRLMGLDDWMLKDMGLDRSEIGSALLNPNNERRNCAKVR